MHRGWYQVAYEREITAPLASVALGAQLLLLVKTEDGIRAYEGRCPHRGMELACGGSLSGRSVICPFHGRRIGLGTGAESGYSVRAYRTLCLGGLVFVLLSEEHENGFTEAITGLDRDHFIVPGFTIRARTAPEFVIENAFDSLHFKHVHKVAENPVMELVPTPGGGLTVRGRLVAPHKNPWQEAQAGPAAVEMTARVFSPTICLTELREPERRYLVLTAATPDATGECVIRVSVIVPAEGQGRPPRQDAIRALLRDSRAAIEQDVAIWEHLPPQLYGRPAPEDDLLRTYYEFCRRLQGAEAR
jgi:3-ketosteroid 9alpha-monooxygenase subunit A